MSSELATGLRLGLRLSLAHHPLCDWFAADMLARRVRVCSGCAVAIPAFFVSLAATIWAAWPPSEPVGLAVAGLCLGLPQATTYVYRGGRAYRALAKGLGGIGLAWVLVGALWAPVPVSWKFAVAAGLGLAFMALQGLRMRAILRTCKACPWRMDWDHCPGMMGFRSQRPVPKAT